nr:hypothetical protein [Tanacetum cinerariifolium]
MEFDEDPALVDLDGVVELTGPADSTTAWFICGLKKYRIIVVKDIFRKICNWWDVSNMEIASFDDWGSWILNLRLSSNHKRLLEGMIWTRKRPIDDQENQFLLISAGAKRVLSSWKRKISSISFQWLSSDFTTRNSGKNLKESNKEKTNGNIDNGLTCSLTQEKNELCCTDSLENDLRYMAVTAFLVKLCGLRPRDRVSITCFGIKNGDQAFDAEGMKMEIKLSNLKTMNTIFATLFNKLGVPINTTILATVLEET